MEDQVQKKIAVSDLQTQIEGRSAKYLACTRKKWQGQKRQGKIEVLFQIKGI